MVYKIIIYPSVRGDYICMLLFKKDTTKIINSYFIELDQLRSYDFSLLEDYGFSSSDLRAATASIILGKHSVHLEA